MPGPMSLKSKIEAERDRLSQQVADMNRALDLIKLFESSANGHRAAPATEPDTAPDAAPARRKRRQLSPAEKKVISKRMKAYWKGRRQSV